MAFEVPADQRDEWAGAVAAATLSAAGLVRRRMARRLARRPSIPANPGAVFKDRWWGDALDDRVTPVLSAAGHGAVGALADSTGLPVDPETATGVVGGLVATAVGLLAARSQVVSDRVAELVDRGRSDGWDAQRLADELGVTGPDMSGPLSDALLAGFADGVTTGVVEGSMTGVLAESDWVAVKTWSTQGDDNVRPEHDDLDGVSVPVDEPFDMDGNDAMYPGDDNLPVDLSVGCRCFLSYEVAPPDSVDVAPDEVAVAVSLSTTESGGAPTIPVRVVGEEGHVSTQLRDMTGSTWVARGAAQFASDTDGIIVTVEPSPTQKAQLAVDGGLDPRLLHVTLAYLTVDPADTTARQVISSVLASIAEQSPEVDGVVSGLGWFDDPASMTLALVDAPGLAALRTMIVAALTDAGYPPDATHDFQPHVTLADGPVDAVDDVNLPLTFMEIRLRWQTEVLVFDLLGPIPTLAPPPDVPPPEPGATPGPSPQEAPVPTASTPTRAFAPVPPPAAPTDGAPSEDPGEGPAPAPDPAFADIDDATLLDELARRALAAAGGDVDDYDGTVRELTDAYTEAIDEIGTEEGAEPPDGGDVAPPPPAAAAVVADATPVDVAPPPAPDVEVPAESTARPFDWEGVLTVEGTLSGDGRIIAESALTWRDLPLPFMLMTANAPGHDGSVVCGSIAEIERVGATIVGRGYFSDNDAGQQAKMLLNEGTLRGVSVDIDSVVAVLADSDGNIIDETSDVDPYTVDIVEMMIEGRLMGATFCPFPAFQEASIHPFDQALVAAAGLAYEGTVWRASANHVFGVAGEVTHQAIVASAAQTVDAPAPSRDLFALRASETAEPFTVMAPLADGTIPCYGLIARWGQCHIGENRRCIPVPKSTDFRSFYTGKKVLTAQGDMLSVGQIIMDTVHPNLRAQASDAQAFYAHTGCAAADVRLYATDEGIVAAGVIRPGTDPVTVRRLRASDISPDWRPINGEHKIVALLAVNTSGFLVEGIAASAGQFRTWALVDTHGHVGAIVAAGALRRSARESLADQVAALSAEVAQLRSMIEAPRVDSPAELEARAAAALAAFGDAVPCEDCQAA